ncbi:Crp/Fnr family transcriptional regulator [Longimicrobium sp.]|uniref:Crp/Fnr family transcriptional regulator n=1 Tax=Longimicrobium sp. TaxID=2029185 RepID=UPI002E367705|nr:Crp/Fnr family transcriptional regulator [Longimicrobium sp.]HEX6038529.1 Crp/Fnr family transcriptional regulator [Longimicrobium sp.]
MHRNRILAALPQDELNRMLPAMQRVDLPLKQVLIDPNRPIRNVYFPEEGVVSIVGLMRDGAAVETATVGNDGMVGMPVFLGTDRMAAQAFVQVSGWGWRMDADAFRAELALGGVLGRRLALYTQALMTLMWQNSACNRLHAAEQRCARWLLLTADRVGGPTMDLTHFFLSQMLGVRRATVTEIAGGLQERGLIEYSRGRITIVDRPGLEALSCECYGVILSEFDRLLGGGTIPSPLDTVDVSEGGLSTAGEGAPAEPKFATRRAEAAGG